MSTNLCISEQLTYSTVRIECIMQDGTTSTGSGFFFNFVQTTDQFVPAIVTNKHVISGSTAGKISLTLRSADGNPVVGKYIKLDLDQFESRWTFHPDKDVDLCAMPIASLINEAEKAGQSFFFIPLDDSLIPTETDLADLGTLEDVLMIGYPNGLWDSVNNMPILRRGITATHPNIDYEGKREFLIDAACFPGSSGSPVFLFNSNGWTNKNGGTVVGGRY